MISHNKFAISSMNYYQKCVNNTKKQAHDREERVTLLSLHLLNHSTKKYTTTITMNHTVIIINRGRSCTMATTITISDHKTTPMLPGGTKFTSPTLHQKSNSTYDCRNLVSHIFFLFIMILHD